jgi:hypothetical protein
MAAAAWLQVLPVILLLLGAQPFPLLLFGTGPASVSAADRSKWTIPMPSVSVTVATEPGGARGGATAAQGVHEGSAKVSFQRGWDSGRWPAGTHLPGAESRVFGG